MDDAAREAANREAEGELSLARIALAEFDGRSASSRAENDLHHAANHVAGALGAAPWLPEAHELLAAVAARSADGGLGLFPLERGYIGTVVAHAHLLAARDPNRALALLCQASAHDPDRPWADVPWVRALDPARIDPVALVRRLVAVVPGIGEPAPESRRRANHVYLDLVRRAVVTYPNEANLHGVGAALARRFGETALAVELGERGYRLDETKLTTTWYAYALRADGRLDDAVALMRRGYERNPFDLDMRADVANWLAGAGRLDEAIAIVEEGMRVDPTYDCAVHTAHRLRFQRDRDPRHLIALNDFIRDNPVESHTHTDLAQACDAQVWLCRAAGATESVINAMTQLVGRQVDVGSLSVAVSALEVPSALTLLRRTYPGTTITIQGRAPADMTRPLRPGPVLWRYDGLVASPAVPMPSAGATERLAALTQVWWRDPVTAHDVALPLGELAPEDLLASLVHPPPSRPMPDGTPAGYWVRCAQAFACLGLLHCAAVGSTVDRRALLTAIAYGIEDWTTEAALFALIVAAWTDPSCREEVAATVSGRFLEAVEANRKRTVTILESMAELVRITPDMPDEVIGMAKDVIAAG